MLFSEWSHVINGKLIANRCDEEVRHLLIDSRKVTSSSGTVFFALRGLSHDGHSFLSEAYSSGIRLFIVEDAGKLTRSMIKHCSVVEVDNALRALQKVGEYHRSQFEIPIVGITGSNGKTIVKEWLSQLLGGYLKVVKSPKSFNSQVGVPLSVWQLSPRNDIGIFEAGISQPGEMANLQKMIKPSLGILTNLGSAHDEGFRDRDQKLAEKLILFEECEKVIYCEDNPWTHSKMIQFQQGHPHVKLVSWSLNDSNADHHYGLSDEAILYKDFRIPLPQKGPAATDNLLHCITACLELGMELNAILGKVRLLSPVSMRLELKRGINGCYLIDDTYNNDLNSLEVALDFISSHLPKKRTTVILSDILQTGKSVDELYGKVDQLLTQRSISRLIGVGTELTSIRDGFQVEGHFHKTTEALLEELERLEFKDEAILVKGARAFGLERIVSRLQEKSHGTRLEIDLNALSSNLDFYRSQLQPGVRLMVMVKALAYGGGSYEIASLLQYHKVDYLAVAYPDEGVELRSKGITTPIMVLNAAPESFGKLIDNDLEPEIFSIDQLRQLVMYDGGGNELRVHIKLETGMNRLGFSPDEINILSEILIEHPWISVMSVFSHLAASENPDQDEFSKHQIKMFDESYTTLCKKLGQRPMRHILNSAGITRFPERQMEMVRLGIGLYGIDSHEGVQSNLIPVSTLKSFISQVRMIEAGDSVGYGRNFIAEKPTKIGIVAVGYADGYDRRLGSGVGKAIVNQVAVKTVGNVCMDMTMLDLTDVEVKEGDEVILFGRDLSVKDLAESIGTIPYEILTNVGGRVKRVFQYS